MKKPLACRGLKKVSVKGKATCLCKVNSKKYRVVSLEHCRGLKVYLNKF